MNRRFVHSVRIIRDPQICGGEPVFKGTRVTLRTVLASLAAGDIARALPVGRPDRDLHSRIV